MYRRSAECSALLYSVSSSSEEEEDIPSFRTMSQTTIGLSTQTLVTHSKAAKWPQYLAALIATISGFIMGTVSGWTAPTQLGLTEGKEYFNRNLSTSEFSLIGGLGPIGCMFGSLVSGPLSDKFGRKIIMLSFLIPSSIGWAFLIWASSVEMMYVGRFLVGIVAGGASVVTPLYTSEIAEVAVRGTLGTYLQLQCTIGILFNYILGCAKVPVYWVSVACFIIPFIYAALMFFMPESPYYLIEKKKENSARSSLQWLRGKNYDISPEIESICKQKEEILRQKVSLKKAFTTRAAIMGLVIGLGTMFFQQFSGINAVVFYTSSIFKSTGSALKPEVGTVIVGAVMAIATFISTLIIDRLGRKPLLFISDVGMAIASAILGVYYYLLAQGKTDLANSISWLPILCVAVFVIFFSFGSGPIPWMFMSEIFPPSIVGPACSIASLFNWLCAFLVTNFFSSIVDSVGKDATFWGFAVISALGAVFVIFLLPETKGKSFEEIQTNLGAKKNTSKNLDFETETRGKSKY